MHRTPHPSIPFLGAARRAAAGTAPRRCALAAAAACLFVAGAARADQRYEFTSGDDGWLTIPTSGAELSAAGGALVQTFRNPTGVFAPVIFAGASFDGSAFRELAMKVTVIGAPTPTFPAAVSTYAGQFFRKGFTLREGTQLVRLTLDHVGPVRSIELDMPAAGSFASFQNMVIKIHWLAVTNDAGFRGAPPERIDPDNPANASGLALASDDRALPPGALPSFLLTPAQVGYGFGSTVMADGSVLFTQWTGGVLQVHPDSHGEISLFSRVTQPFQLSLGLFGIHFANGALLALDHLTNEVRRLGDNALIFGGGGAKTPMQVASDATGNLLVAWQGLGLGAGFVQQRSPAGVFTTVAGPVDLPAGVALSGGAPYFVTHTRTDGRCEAKGDTDLTTLDEINGMPLTDAVGGVGNNGHLRGGPGLTKDVGGTLDLYWRARGIATDTRTGSPSFGSIYVVEESNAWDQSNSGRITRYSPATGAVTTVAQGLDYPEFPSFGPRDGRLYFNLSHDGYGAAYDPAAVFTPVASGRAGVAMAISGGTWSLGAARQAITLYDPQHPGDQLSITGSITPALGVHTVSGWIRLPDDYLPRISKASCGGGCFPVPAVAVGSLVGQVKAVVLPLRKHRGPRWPARACGNADRLGFDDSPEEYLVFFQWTYAGVEPGASQLIAAGQVQLSDRFDAGVGGRTATGEVPPAGSPQLLVEDVHGNAPRAWPAGRFAFHRDDNAWAPYPGTSDHGSATGMTQSVAATSDWGVAYDLASDFVVQADWVQTTDRIDLTSSDVPGSIAGASGLSVFFRASGSALPEIGVYNALRGETAASDATGALLRSGTAVGSWHNYGVRFDLARQRLSIFVDEQLRGVIDLTTFAGGRYRGAIGPATNDHVSVGYAQAAFGAPVWSDNFQVGRPLAP